MHVAILDELAILNDLGIWILYLRLIGVLEMNYVS